MDKEYYKNLADKYFAGSITETDISELAGWIKSNTRLSQWWEEEFEKSDADISPALRDKMFERIKAEVLNPSVHTPDAKAVKSVRLPLRLLKWAAMICLPVCLAFFTYYLLNVSGTGSQSPFIVKADKGDKATVALPDGTDVILNSASQLSYLSDFNKKERRVQLEGEGYFKVAHDARHTFIVQVGELEIKVMGTQFNVRAYNDSQDITVVLLEGKVGVYAPLSSVTMKPGEKMNYNKSTHKLTTEQVVPEDYVGWTQGSLYFHNESLQSIMQTLSRVYNVTIHIDSPKIAGERFTGTIPGSSIQNALDVIMLTSNFRYVVEDSVILLKEK